MQNIKIPIESNFIGNYRLEYDGKYITLFGRDKNYPHNKWSENEIDSYMEMVLVPCVIEVRNANPKIISIDDENIVVELGLINN